MPIYLSLKYSSRIAVNLSLPENKRKSKHFGDLNLPFDRRIQKIDSKMI